MPYVELHGNLFASRAQAYVNTVNCVGAMGKGIALEFRRRYPRMFAQYYQICRQRQLQPGQILPYRKESPWILNFAIKNDWKHPSKIEWIETCLEKFCARYRDMGISSVAFPWMGAMNGGLPLEQIQAVTRRYLRTVDDISVEVSPFDPEAPDPLDENMFAARAQLPVEEIAQLASVNRSSAAVLRDVALERKPPSFTRLLEATGFGKSLADKVYAFALRVAGDAPPQQPRSQTSMFTDDHGRRRPRVA